MITLVAPAAFDFYIASDAGAADLTNLSILRVVRVVRLVKVVRLVRASRLYKRWQAYMSLSYANETIVQVILMVLITCHWYACIIMLQASLHPHADQTWLGPRLYGFCLGSTSADADADADGDVGNAEAPLGSVLRGCEGLGLGTQYLASFSWSVMVITGMGGTDFYPSPASDVETTIVTAMVLVGAILWTIILAKFCNVATNSDPSLTYFYQKLDDLNRFTADNNVPKEMARRLREYLLQQKEFILRDNSAKSIPMLSTALQIEVVLQCNRHWLSGIWFLRDLEEICLVRICSSLVSKTLAPGELAPRRYLYVVKRGFVLFGGRVLSAGGAWGDDVLLTDERYFLPNVGRALTYCDLFTLARDALVAAVGPFAISAASLRRNTVKLALCRHMIMTHRLIKGANAEKTMLTSLGQTGSAEAAGQTHAKSVTLATQLEQYSGPVSSVPGMSGARQDEETASSSEIREVKEGIKTLHTEMGALRDQMKRLARLVERTLPPDEPEI